MICVCIYIYIMVGNPHPAQIAQFELFELVAVSELYNQFPVERFQATVSQSTVPFAPLTMACCIYVYNLCVYIYIYTHTRISIQIYKPYAGSSHAAAFVLRAPKHK